MAKFIVEAGGFVSVLRKRRLKIYAENECEAEQKAIEKFVEIQQNSGGDISHGDVTINSIFEA